MLDNIQATMLLQSAARKKSSPHCAFSKLKVTFLCFMILMTQTGDPGGAFTGHTRTAGAGGDLVRSGCCLGIPLQERITFLNSKNINFLNYCIKIQKLYLTTVSGSERNSKRGKFKLPIQEIHTRLKRFGEIPCDTKCVWSPTFIFRLRYGDCQGLSRVMIIVAFPSRADNTEGRWKQRKRSGLKCCFISLWENLTSCKIGSVS